VLSTKLSTTDSTVSMANKTKTTTRVRATFLDTLRETSNVTASAAATGVSRDAFYRARENDPAFAAAWDEAVEVATDALEAEARRRAITGVEEPVYYLGKEVGRIRKYSDRMLEILLKAHRPGKFRENVSMEHSNPDGSALTLAVTFVAPDTSTK
jgi:hypothetical protein